MCRNRRVLLRAFSHHLPLYTATVVAWLVLVWPVGLGSTLKLALYGAVLAAILGGLSLGAAFGVRLTRWRSLRAFMPAVPTDAIRPAFMERVAAMLLAGFAGGLIALIWAAFTDVSLWQIVAAHGVLGSVFICSVGIGGIWGRFLQTERLAVVFGLLCWAPLVTAFAWLPAVAPRTSAWLALAVNVNPLAGVLSALRMQRLFWNPLLYSRLPYAEYAVRVRGAWELALLWAGVGAVFIVTWLWMATRDRTPRRLR